MIYLSVMTQAQNATRVKEFFASLANTPDLDLLPEAERSQLLAELSRLRGFTGLESSVSAFWKYLYDTAGQALHKLLRGEAVAFPWLGSLVLKVEDRQLRETFTPDREESELFHAFFAVLREQPFPFGKCAYCHKVFMQPARGRMRQFCSSACQTKSVQPQRTEYMRTYRQQEHALALAKARAILRETPNAEVWPALQRAFRGKSRRQLVNLKEQAEQTGAVTGTPNAERDR